MYAVQNEEKFKRIKYKRVLCRAINYLFFLNVNISLYNDLHRLLITLKTDVIVVLIYTICPLKFISYFFPWYLQDFTSSLKNVGIVFDMFLQEESVIMTRF